MISKKQPSLKVLIITFEYKEQVTGGIGRVINGITPFMRTHMAFDVFLLEWRYLTSCISGRLYRNKKGRRFERKRKYFLWYLHVIRKLIEKEKYQVVHILHSSKYTRSLVAMVKNRFPEIRIVYSCHSIARYEREIRNNSPSELKSEEVLVDKADHIHLLNKVSASYFEQSYPGRKNTRAFSIIPNGIEESEYHAIDRDFYNSLSEQLNKRENIVVLCISRWSHGKGIESILDAAPKIISQYPAVRFVLAGRKTISWEHEIGKYVSAIDKKIEAMKQHVVSFGWVNEIQRNTLFSLADISVMPSRLEYFPYSLLEPMICKVPVVSSKIPCAEEILSENEDCLFFHPENPDELAEKILKLVADKELRKNLAFNAYLKVKRNCDWKNVASGYVQMYHRLAERELTAVAGYAHI